MAPHTRPHGLNPRGRSRVLMGVRARRLELVLLAALLTACQPTVPQGGTTPATSPTPTPAASSAVPSQRPKPPTPSAPAPVEIALTGDLLWHNTLIDSAREDGHGRLDFRPGLAGIRGVISAADVAVCQNEVPIAPKGGPYRNYPQFSAPEQTLDAVRWAGYDACTTASNHSVDQGYAGLARTLRALDARHLAHTGTARTRTEANRPLLVATKNGGRVAVITGTYGTNGLPLPAGKPWAVADLDAARLLAHAKAGRKAGADIVLVAVHAGDEYVTTPTAQQRHLADVLTASPYVDAVYGHHVHVVQPITRVHGKIVAYGLGNLIAQHKTDVVRGYEGIVLTLRFERRGTRYVVTRATYRPTLITHYAPGRPARVRLVNDDLQAHRGSTSRLEAARARTRAAVSSLGRTKGVVEA